MSQSLLLRHQLALRQGGGGIAGAGVGNEIDDAGLNEALAHGVKPSEMCPQLLLGQRLFPICLNNPARLPDRPSTAGIASKSRAIVISNKFYCS